MFGVWCVCGAAHNRKLKTACKRQPDGGESEFLSWIDGVWTFRVKHFTKYGVNVDHDDDDAAMVVVELSLIHISEPTRPY